MSSTATDTLASPVAATKINYVPLILLCVGHFFIDLYSSALGAFQPLLVAKHNMSLSQAGILGGALVFSASLAQPVYGYFSDRYRSKLFSCLAPAVAGIFISALGMAPSFTFMVMAALLGGAGIASFHPQGSAWATVGIEQNRQRWFAVFISSGTLGYAMGPTFFSFFLTRIGLEQGLWLAVPGVAISVMMMANLVPPSFVGVAKHKFDWKPLWEVRKTLFLLYLLVFIRSIVQVTYGQMLPLYLIKERGFTYGEATATLSLYLTAGALGGFIGGSLADRMGGRKVILLSMALCIAPLAIFFMTTGWISVVSLTLAGLVLLFTIPVNVVMAQQLAPSQSGVISALMMGFAWGTAGLIFIPLTGWVGDHYSLGTAMSSLAAFPIIGAVLAWMLPKEL